MLNIGNNFFFPEINIGNNCSQSCMTFFMDVSYLGFIFHVGITYDVSELIEC
jgi:hypothetical protein